MTKILIFTDFDGTMTGREGSKTVFGEFYQSLMVGYSVGVRQDYKWTALKSPEEIQKLFEEKFGKYGSDFNYAQEDADLLMSADAVAFFKQAINNPAITVKIITRNRQDYIQALLKYQGFSPEEISKIIIEDKKLKNIAVIESLSAEENMASKPTHIYVLDDSPADYGAMVSIAEAQEYGYRPEQIKKYNQGPGQFQWAQYQQDIQALFPTPIKDQPIEPTPTGTNANSTSTKKKTDVVIDKEHSTLSPEDPHKQTSSEDKNQSISLERLNAERSFKISLSSFAAGFFVGLLASTVLIATGVLAPLGFGIIGLIALNIATASGLGLLSGTIAFGVAKSTESKELPQNDEQFSLNGSSQHLQSLGGSVDKTPSHDAHVGHFPSIIGSITQPNSENRPNIQQEHDDCSHHNVAP